MRASARRRLGRTLVVGTETALGHALLAELPDAHGVSASRLDHHVDLSAYELLINARGASAGVQSEETGEPEESGEPEEAGEPEESGAGAAALAYLLADAARRYEQRYVHISADCVFDRSAAEHPEDELLSLRTPHGQALAAGEHVARGVPRHWVLRTGWVIGSTDSVLAQWARDAVSGACPSVVGNRYGRLTFADQLAAGITHLMVSEAPVGTYNITGDGPAVSLTRVARRVFELRGADPARVCEVSEPGGGGAADSGVLALDRIKATGFRPGNSWLQLADRLPQPQHSTSGEIPRGRTAGSAEPYRVLFVCTANICRSAYADVVTQRFHSADLQFGSAGIQALVGEGLDPPLAELVGERGDPSTHRARQLTRELVTDADLIITMAAEHRRYILDEWPAQGRKVFVIGQVAHELADLPAAVTLQGLATHLWEHRSNASGEITDPYRRGRQAAAAAAAMIDGYLHEIVGGLRSLLPRDAVLPRRAETEFL